TGYPPEMVFRESGSLRCFRCGADWLAEGRSRPGFKETCPHCNAWVHCCKNCRLHDPRAHNGCLSATTDWVGDPQKQNFCGEFEYAQTAAASTGASDPAAKSTFNALFSGKLSLEEESTPKDFDSLFGE